MFKPPNGDEVLDRLVRWADGLEPVRALVLTSTRAVPEGCLDPFSDYDVILGARDVRPFYDDRSWLSGFGRVLVVYRDPLRSEGGCDEFAYITQYESGLKMDFTLWSPGVFRRVATGTPLPDVLDVGYAVLLDKDGLTEGWAAPTHEAFVPKPPSEEEYQELVETFLHEATYVAKHLWRGELLPAKYNLDHAMKQRDLRRILEWMVELDSDWSVPVKAYGKGLRERLPARTWSELERTYVGAGVEENWEALFATIRLFRRVADEVGGRLGFRYPHDLDGRVTAYLDEVREFPVPESRESA